MNIGIYAFLGAGSIVSGSMRISLSISIILVETTGNIDFIVPIMIICFTSKYIGDIFNNSIVDETIEKKNMPFIELHPP